MPVLTFENTNLAQALVNQAKKETWKEAGEEALLFEKRMVLARLLNKKFGLNHQEERYIRNYTNLESLDQAIDEIIFAESKEEVLNCLS